MAKYSFIDTIESRDYVIKKLSENKNLSDWEKGFIKSIDNYVHVRNGFLSENQKLKLSDLWEKY